MENANSLSIISNCSLASIPPQNKNMGPLNAFLKVLISTEKLQQKIAVSRKAFNKTINNGHANYARTYSYFQEF